MFWILLLCHFIGDYPLQTDGMVRAKKQFSGLLMHVFIHFVTMLTLLTALMSLQTGISLILALSVSAFHFAIDHWKNVLSRLRPTWIIFSYVQDQILHLLSIILVSFVYSQYSGDTIFHSENLAILYTTGIILTTHFWFVTERVLSCKCPEHLQWINASMWHRMMSRGMLYSILFIDNMLVCLALVAGAMIVGWNDLDSQKRSSVLVRDLGGVSVLVALSWFLGKQLL
ncbi:MAG: DUF3307 domain-containing protein [Methyloprofundus sp.]|nr:DUF3307 domain-containing protein [Methyloprofundus sp.]